MVPLFVALVGLAPPHVQAAREAIAELRYDRALAELDAALRAGDSGPREVAEILQLLGEVSASMDLSEAAVGHFSRLLEVDPAASLGDVSPKLAQPFADAKAALGGRSLAVHHELVRVPAPALVLVVDSDPLGLVVGARATFGERRVEARGSGRIQLPLPAGERLVIQLAALDRYGNRLTEETVEVRPSEAPPLYARWWTWGIAAGAAVATATAFALSARSEHDDATRLTASSSTTDFRRVQSLDDDAHRDALIANLGFGAAAACAIVSAVLLLREPPPVTPTVANGAGLSLRIRF